MQIADRNGNVLFCTNSFVLYVLVLIFSSTCWAKAVHGSLDIVVAELTYLLMISYEMQGTRGDF
jgi:hypothetical protein